MHFLCELVILQFSDMQFWSSKSCFSCKVAALASSGGSRILGDQGLSPEGADADLFFPSFFAASHTKLQFFCTSTYHQFKAEKGTENRHRPLKEKNIKQKSYSD